MAGTQITKQGAKVTFRDIATHVFAKHLPVESRFETRREGDLLKFVLGSKDKNVLRRLDEPTFEAKIAEYEAAIKRLSKTAKLALTSAYVFASKVPKDEREDVFSDIALAILEAKTTIESHAYTIARFDWRDWWSRYRTRQHYNAGYLSEIEVEANPPLDYDQDTFEQALETAKFANETKAHLRKVKADHDQERAERAERARARELSELAVSTVEFETQVIGDMDGARLWQKLPKPIQAIVGKRLAGKALNPAERKRLSRFAQSHLAWLQS